MDGLERLTWCTYIFGDEFREHSIKGGRGIDRLRVVDLGSRGDSQDVTQQSKKSWGASRRTSHVAHETNPNRVATGKAARDSDCDSTMWDKECEVIRLVALGLLDEDFLTHCIVS